MTGHAIPDLIESAERRSVEDVAEGIDTNRLPASTALEGTLVAATLADGGATAERRAPGFPCHPRDALPGRPAAHRPRRSLVRRAV